jgi:hypothetical protein
MLMLYLHFQLLHTAKNVGQNEQLERVNKRKADFEESQGRRPRMTRRYANREEQEAQEASQCWRRMHNVKLKLTPFHGHLIVQQEGVQNAQTQTAVFGAISRADG